jgi:RNAse (barnase) inhibitor barstar
VKNLPDILSDFRASGVFRLTDDAPIKELEELAKQYTYTFFLLEGAGIQGKEQFLNRASAVFSFPDYFGNNWDAFEDCLTDMSWHETDGFLILYDHFEAFAEHAPDQFKIALEILRDSASYWRDQRKPMFVLLRGHEEQRWELPSIAF